MRLSNGVFEPLHVVQAYHLKDMILINRQTQRALFKETSLGLNVYRSIVQHLLTAFSVVT